MIRQLAFLGTVLFSWQWTQGEGSAATGFKLLIGSKPGVYSQTITLGVDARNATVPNLDTSKPLYAVVKAFNEWGESSSSELVLGGAPQGPFSVMARMAN